MELINTFAALNQIRDPLVATLGTFDGLHRGHSKLMSETLAYGQAKGIKTILITFDRHPLEVLHHKRVPKLIESHVRLETLKRMSFDYVFIIPLDASFLKMEGKDFVCLLKKSSIEAIFVGENYTFGKHASGTVELLQKEFPKEVHSIRLEAYEEGKVISSTTIRQAIEEGQMEEANALLGRPYGFTGTVVLGDQRGRLLGFPTANSFIPDELVIPKDGVYVNRVHIEDSIFYGVGNVGDNPTFQNQKHRFEAHLFDFNENIYGKEMYIEFLSFLRSEEKFNSLEELIEQMEDDKRRALEYIEKIKEQET